VRNTIIFILSIAGILAGLVAAYLFGAERPSQPPVFTPVSSPFDTAIYANGIIESDQASGSNSAIYPEVAGPITQVLVKEGQAIQAGTLLFTIENSVQKATTLQLRLQADAALAVLNELKAQPRAEILAVAQAQVSVAQSILTENRNQYDKRRASFEMDPRSISKDIVESALDATNQASSGLAVAQKQRDLIQAGAWSFDIITQQLQYESIVQSARAAEALLAKYAVTSQTDGVILAVNASVGGFASSQGIYNAYTQGSDPLVIVGAAQEHLSVRCFVDEILVARLPVPMHIQAQMSVRGTDTKIPLEFVRVQPYVSPKIELSNGRTERVDLRVLPVIFRFTKLDAPVYPGQLVDVFIGHKP
jgi:HlyD family secretion protein